MANDVLVLRIPLDCLTSFLGSSLSRAVSSFGRITIVLKLAITAESYIRSWRKPPEMPEVCRMRRVSASPAPPATLHVLLTSSRISCYVESDSVMTLSDAYLYVLLSQVLGLPLMGHL